MILRLRLPCLATFTRITDPQPINELSVRRACKLHGIERKVVAR